VFHIHRLGRRRVRTGTARPIRGGFGLVRPVLLTALCATLVTLGTVAPTVSLPAAIAQPQYAQPAQPPSPQAPQEMPLDTPLRMIAEARQRAQQINDYQCLLISQERVKGKLLPENVMQMSFRKTPFSVYMKWLAPKEDTGQEVCFVYGRNQNKMRVHAAGFGGNFGWLTIDVNDPKVMEHSRHTITEAGFSNLLERCARCWEAERNLNKTRVNIAEYDYNKRRCIRVETIHTERQPSFYCYRNVIYFDKETWLPVRMESYDWPRQGGPQDGDLLECFSYVDVRVNVGLTDQMFNH
jgi:hypothetical protein